MPKGPKGQKRPADVISNAVRVMKIATGELVEAPSRDNAKIVARAAKGGAARANRLSAAERQRIAAKAARSRWKKR